MDTWEAYVLVSRIMEMVSDGLVAGCGKSVLWCVTLKYVLEAAELDLALLLLRNLRHAILWLVSI
jgi:hypothetical protein